MAKIAEIDALPLDARNRIVLLRDVLPQPPKESRQVRRARARKRAKNDPSDRGPRRGSGLSSKP